MQVLRQGRSQSLLRLIPAWGHQVEAKLRSEFGDTSKLQPPTVRSFTSAGPLGYNFELGTGQHVSSFGLCSTTVFGHLQHYGITTSAWQAASEEIGDMPVRSPLSQAPGPVVEGTGRKLGVSEDRSAQAVLTAIRQSPQKLNMVAEMVRGMRVEDALTQMAVSPKRAAKTVAKVMHSARANAIHNYGLDKDRLVVAEAFVGKDKYLKRAMPHGKGKSGRMEHARSRLTVVVKEISMEKEADLARLRVFRRQGTRMSPMQSRLVPHLLLETQWKRQRTPPAEPSD